MTTPVLTFFNNKSGVGKTSLVYHAAWMLSELGRGVLVVDLDPQATLTAAFLDEDALAELWDEDYSSPPKTIYRCVKPLTEVGDIMEPELHRAAQGLYLLPGDLALSGFEDNLSTEWPGCLGSQNLYRPFRVITAFWQIIQQGAEQSGADIVLVDVGPSLGAINRSALIATDYVVVPLAADPFSRQGLLNLGPTLRRWRADWRLRLENWDVPGFDLPAGTMWPIGYLIQQHGVRLSRPVQASCLSVFPAPRSQRPYSRPRVLLLVGVGPIDRTPTTVRAHLADVERQKEAAFIAPACREVCPALP